MLWMRGLLGPTSIHRPTAEKLGRLALLAFSVVSTTENCLDAPLISSAAATFAGPPVLDSVMSRIAALMLPGTYTVERAPAARATAHEHTIVVRSWPEPARSTLFFITIGAVST